MRRLQDYHYWLREWGCFFLGHDWKHSPRRPSKYYDMEEEEIPYVERVGKGNYLWETVAWWSSKCIRCRLKTKEWAWHPWYKNIRQGLKGGFWEVKWYSRYLFSGEDYKANWKVCVIFIPLILCSLWKQIFVHFDRLPVSLYEVPMELEWQLIDFLDDVERGVVADR